MSTKQVQYLKYVVIAIFVSIMSFFAYQFIVEYFKVLEHNKVVKYQIVTKEIVDKQVLEQSQRKSNSHSNSEENSAETKFEIIGVVNFELSEKTSWHTIAKLLVTVLGAWFGIKLINHFFRRWA